MTFQIFDKERHLRNWSVGNRIQPQKVLDFPDLPLDLCGILGTDQVDTVVDLQHVILPDAHASAPCMSGKEHCEG